MKRLIILIVLVVCQHHAPAQAVAMELDKQNVMYVGIDNPVTLAPAGYQPKDLLVSIDQGSITKIDENGHYIIIPLHVGGLTVIISAKTKTGVRQISEKHFRTKCIPAPVITLSGKHNGCFQASYIRCSIGPVATLEGFDFDAKFVITGFKIIVTRDKTVILEEVMHNPGGIRFSDSPSVLKVIQSLKAGDRLRIETITYVGPSGKSNNCEEPAPVELIVN